MFLLRRLVLCCVVVVSCALHSTRATGAEPMAGWSEVEITPPLGIALGGRGGNYTLAKQVLDPLYAQVTYLKDSKGTGFVIVSLDLVGLSHSFSHQLRQMIVQELGVDWNLILLNTSHTHSGPNMMRDLMAGVGPAPEIEVEYFKTLHEQLRAAVRKARDTMGPIAKVEMFEGTSQVAINRRGKNRQGNISILPNPTGPIDEKLWVMRVTPAEQRPGALIFSYACHPVIVYGYAYAAISADFPGVTRGAI
ncbi:MAG: hypothetical protein ACK4UN_21745, partial [Limisphaerales bacterium]